MIAIHYQQKGQIQMPSKLCKWGNSLGVRLPQHVAECAGLSAGDYLYINLIDGEIIIRPVKARDVHSGYAAKDSAESASVRTNSTETPAEKW